MTKRRLNRVGDYLTISFVIWFFVALAFLGLTMGDCIEPDCPSESERAARIYGAIVIGMVLQALATVWYVRIRRRGSESDV